MLENLNRIAVFWMAVLENRMMVFWTSARSVTGSRGRVPRK